MPFTDTHCHIHEADFPEPEGAYTRALAADVRRLLCVGTDETTSRAAVNFAQAHDHTWAVVGVHPHEASTGMQSVHTVEQLIQIDKNNHVGKIVAIGECGLDYFYNHSTRDHQLAVLQAQLDLAVRYNLPVSFHVRDAQQPAERSVWDDFWPLIDALPNLSGVLHSFTDSVTNLEKALSRGWYIGVNGIVTFARTKSQLDMYAAIPLGSLVLETDSPFLTPVPHRGTINEPAYIPLVANHLAQLQRVDVDQLVAASEQNATKLFSITET